MVTVPLILLAIPSVYSGAAYVGNVVFGGFFGDSIMIAQDHAGLREMREDWHGVVAFMVHGLTGLPIDLALAGIAVAWYLYIKRPDLPAKIAARLGWIYTLLVNNYYFDKFNDWFFAGGARRIGTLFSEVGDRSIIDGFIVNGSARLVGAAAGLLRHLQTGRVYHYAFAMILSVFFLLTWWVAH